MEWISGKRPSYTPPFGPFEGANGKGEKEDCVALCQVQSYSPAGPSLLLLHSLSLSLATIPFVLSPPPPLPLPPLPPTFTPHPVKREEVHVASAALDFLRDTNKTQTNNQRTRRVLYVQDNMAVTIRPSRRAELSE